MPAVAGKKNRDRKYRLRCAGFIAAIMLAHMMLQRYGAAAVCAAETLTPAETGKDGTVSINAGTEKGEETGNSAKVKDGIAGDSGGEESTVSGNSGGEESTVSGNSGEEKGTVSGNGGEESPAGQEKEDAGPEADTPSSGQEIIDLSIPTKFTMALNPYRYKVRMGDGQVSTGQVLSKNYGIANKSSVDLVVTVTLTIEDGNGGQIVFVDSEEEALAADQDTCAVCLELIPSDGSAILADGKEIGADTGAESLSDVSMGKAESQGLVLHEGENTVSFLLKKADYSFGNMGNGTQDGEAGESPLLLNLDKDGKGVTAFTFSGAMNENADWTSLEEGVAISAAYAYETAAGDEEAAEGTGAMLK